MRKLPALMALAALAGLAGCAQPTDLAVQPGQQLPPAPYGRAVPPAASELLDPRPEANPERSVELRTRSEEREDDPFDLPPPEN